MGNLGTSDGRQSADACWIRWVRERSRDTTLIWRALRAVDAQPGDFDDGVDRLKTALAGDLAEQLLDSRRIELIDLPTLRAEQILSLVAVFRMIAGEVSLFGLQSVNQADPNQEIQVTVDRQRSNLFAGLFFELCDQLIR